ETGGVRRSAEGAENHRRRAGGVWVIDNSDEDLRRLTARQANPGASGARAVGGGRNDVRHFSGAQSRDTARKRKRRWIGDDRDSQFAIGATESDSWIRNRTGSCGDWKRRNVRANGAEGNCWTCL